MVVKSFQARKGLWPAQCAMPSTADDPSRQRVALRRCIKDGGAPHAPSWLDLSGGSRLTREVSKCISPVRPYSALSWLMARLWAKGPIGEGLLNGRVCYNQVLTASLPLLLRPGRASSHSKGELGKQVQLVCLDPSLMEVSFPVWKPSNQYLNWSPKKKTQWQPTFEYAGQSGGQD